MKKKRTMRRLDGGVERKDDWEKDMESREEQGDQCQRGEDSGRRLMRQRLDLWLAADVREQEVEWVSGRCQTVWMNCTCWEDDETFDGLRDEMSSRLCLYLHLLAASSYCRPDNHLTNSAASFWPSFFSHFVFVCVLIWISVCWCRIKWPAEQPSDSAFLAFSSSTSFFFFPLLWISSSSFCILALHLKMWH